METCSAETFYELPIGAPLCISHTPESIVQGTAGLWRPGHSGNKLCQLPQTSLHYCQEHPLTVHNFTLKAQNEDTSFTSDSHCEG